MKFIFTLLIPILMLLPCRAQERKESAREEIAQLRKGALLVRLKTGSLQLKALEESGNTKDAAAYRKKMEDENNEVVKAFREEFRFCPVYFFYSNNSGQIRAGHLAGCLLNKDLQPDSSLVPDTNYFLTAETGFSEEQHIEGLIIMDRNFKQLETPFPFLIRKYQGPAVKRSVAQMVKLLDKELLSKGR